MSVNAVASRALHKIKDKINFKKIFIFKCLCKIGEDKGTDMNTSFTSAYTHHVLLFRNAGRRPSKV
jgi:hypothetical protein